MSWYQAVVTLDGALDKVGRELPMIFFDRRTLAELDSELRVKGSIEAERTSSDMFKCGQLWTTPLCHAVKRASN